MTQDFNNQFARGSEWRKWDLHIHSPKTYLANNFNSCPPKDYIQKIKEAKLEVLGYTNYFKFTDEDFQLIKELRQEGIIVFPNLEFRLDVSVNKAGEEVHIHILFSDTVSTDSIKTLCTKLNTTITKNGANITCSGIKEEKDFISASINTENLKKVAKEVFGDEKQYLICAASNNNGLRPDNKSPRKLNITDEIDKLSDAFFGGTQNTQYYLQKDRYEDKSVIAKPKPVFYCSDAHKLGDIGTKFTWIKADPTWEGLKQVLVNPAERVFIGEEPPKTKTVRGNKNKFIDRIGIRLKEDNKGEVEKWFDGMNVSLNSDLVAIIGNKGSGKSALADVIAFVDGKKSKSFSFLLKDRFGEKDKAKKFEAQLWWKDEIDKTKEEFIKLDSLSKPKNSTSNISEEKDSDSTKIEYIPQYYFDRLCTAETNYFEKEVHRIIFSHVKTENKREKENLQDLLSEIIKEKINQTNTLRDQIKEKNQNTVELENRLSESYQKAVANDIKDNAEKLS